MKVYNIRIQNSKKNRKEKCEKIAENIQSHFPSLSLFYLLRVHVLKQFGFRFII